MYRYAREAEASQNSYEIKKPRMEFQSVVGYLITERWADKKFTINCVWCTTDIECYVLACQNVQRYTCIMYIQKKHSKRITRFGLFPNEMICFLFEFLTITWDDRKCYYTRLCIVQFIRLTLESIQGLCFPSDVLRRSSTRCSKRLKM